MRGLRLRLAGRRIVRASLHRDGLRFAFPPGLAESLRGARVEGFARRAKYILMRLDHGTTLLIHLGMSGRVRLDERPDRPRGLHEHVVLEMEDGWQVGLIDPRRFGALDLVVTADEADHVLLRRLGPEPLEAAFRPAVLAASLAGRRTSIKAALLDQRVVAGLGNIYVCEALFRARISPERKAGAVSAAGVRRLVTQIRATLSEAIAAGGSSLRDYVQPDGALGYFQHAWKVYGREGMPCERCPGDGASCALIVRTVQAARSTFWCPKTQN